MEKRGIILVLSILILFSINLVSAQLFGGYGFSIESFFDSFDSATVTYFFVFLILFTLITWGLARLPMFRDAYGKPNSMITGTLGFSVSALAVYYMYRNDFGLEDFFYDIGISGDIFSILIGILIIAVIALIIWKFKFKGFFIMVGSLLILISLFTEIIYERGLALITGIIFLIVGLFLLFKKKGNSKSEDTFIDSPPNRRYAPSGLTRRQRKIQRQRGREDRRRAEEEYYRQQEKRAQKEQRRNQGRQAQEIPRQQQETGRKSRKQRTEQEKLNLARKIGIKNLEKEYSKLQKEYEKGVKNAEELHRKATKLGWNKTKEGNKYYKAWHKQYQRLDIIRKRIEEIQQRIQHLRSQIR
jgi:hypothetical protein